MKKMNSHLDNLQLYFEQFRKNKEQIVLNAFAIQESRSQAVVSDIED